MRSAINGRHTVETVDYQAMLAQLREIRQQFAALGPTVNETPRVKNILKLLGQTHLAIEEIGHLERKAA